MALPQRGQLPEQEAQVVPQEEQVLQVAPRLFTQLPFHVVQGQEALPTAADAELLSVVQADCGNSGRLKNSSHTFSANSSQGGMEQKP